MGRRVGRRRLGGTELMEVELTARQGRGELPADADPAACTRVVLATPQGYLLQRAAFRSDEPELFSQGLRLMFRV